MKKCSRCKEIKDDSCYWNITSRHGKSTLFAYCKPCANLKKKQWMKDNPELVKGQSIRRMKNMTEKERKIRLMRSKKKRDDLADSYIIDLLIYNSPLEREDITSEMIEMHRLSIQLKRKLRTNYKS